VLELPATTVPIALLALTLTAVGSAWWCFLRDALLPFLRRPY
jgi:hypothetical protein